MQSGKFTLLIPAAGKGSRLGGPGPKILYPIKGSTPLEILLKRFSPYVSEAVLVVSPSGKTPVEERLREIEVKVPVRLAIQAEPVGMVDAILRAGPLLADTDDVIVVWGDQILLSKETIETAAKAYWENSDAVVVPTVPMKAPYVHFERDESGRISRCLLRREGDAMPDEGESDCGLFILKANLLKKPLWEFSQSKEQIGKGTGEVSFPPYIPHLTALGHTVRTTSVRDFAEALGLNTPSDLKIIEARLK